MNQGREVRVKRMKEKDNKRERENKRRLFFSGLVCARDGDLL